MPATTVAAVVLAAGRSQRMGQPKPLMEWRGKTWLEHVIHRLEAGGCSRIVVVTGAIELPSSLLSAAESVDNPGWQNGQLSSLQAGISHLGQSPPTGVLVATVDRPHVQAQTFAGLVDAHDRDPGAIWQPCHDQKRGHPVLYPWEVAATLLQLPPTATARALLARPEVATRRQTLDVDDPAVLDNLDRPEDVEQRLPP